MYNSTDIYFDEIRSGGLVVRCIYLNLREPISALDVFLLYNFSIAIHVVDLGYVHGGYRLDQFRIQ